MTTTDSTLASNPQPPSLPWGWLLGYLFFVVYGSLVPLDLKPMALDLAWQRFQNISFLQLGIASRADWISNGVLYFPVGLLLAERFIGKVRGATLAFALTCMLVPAAALAIGVEFLQLFFPPRTVSLNDIAAELLGAALGIASAGWLVSRVRLLEAFRLGQIQLSPVLLFQAFLFAYLAYAFFPFDFVVSAAEFSAKLDSSKWGWLLAQGLSTSFLRGSALLGFEAALAIPVGFFIARQPGWGAKFGLAGVALAGAALGLVIELVQLFLFSGVSQGASVASRMVGVLCGGWVALQKPGFVNWQAIRPALKRLVTPVFVFYLGAVLLVSGWFQPPLLSSSQAFAKLSGMHYLPFYYHYYTTEAHALTSLATIVALYLPLACLLWVRGTPRALATMGIGALALLVEAAKLFSSQARPDPTNVLIAAATAWLAVATLSAIGAIGNLAASPQRLSQPGPATHHSANGTATPPWHWVGLALLAAATVVWLVNFPVQPALLAALYAAVAAAIWFKPISALLVVPVALPLLDLAPWSGRFYLDEFDWLMAIVVSVALARTTATKLPKGQTVPPLVFRLAFGLLLLSFAISTARALLPWSPPDLNSFLSYFSPYNALRITKGMVWAVLFGIVLRRLGATTPVGFNLLAWGMTIGLAGTVAIILQEKILFGGLFNLDSTYRVTGPFSAIHTGGAYIEGYLAVAAPFVIYLILQTRKPLLWLGGAALLLASTYALMSTISRNGFVAFGVAGALTLVFSLMGKKRSLTRGALAAGLALAVGGVVYLMLQGTFVQQRMSQIDHDLAVRTAHWHHSLALRDDNLLTSLFGMGVGRFPDAHYWRSSKAYHPSAHSLAQEANNTYLRIAPGNTVYIEQIVRVQPQQVYQLTVNVRAVKAGSTVGIALCEKWMLASSRCATWQRSPAATQPNQWVPFAVSIPSNDLGGGTWLSTRPVKLSFFTNGGSVVDIDKVTLTGQNGEALITNGDFESGVDRWFFAADEHLSWHVKSLPLGLLFDQGWFGLFAFVSASLIALAVGVRHARAGNAAAGVSVAAMAGFLVTGAFDTLIDAPRFLFLIAMLVLMAAQPAPRTTAK